MRRQLYAIYLINALEGLAGSLVNVFIPIYLLQLGFSLSRVLWFLAEWSIWICVWFFLAAVLAGRIGLKRVMALRLPVLLAYFLMLYQLPHSGLPLSVLAVTISASTALFWYPIHIMFGQRLKGDEDSEEIGKFFAYPQFLAIFAPLLGAAITVYAGFNYLFLAAGALYLAGLVPLIWITDYKPAGNLHPKKILFYLRRYPIYVWTEIVENMREDAEAYLWPIFVYLSLGSMAAIEGSGAQASIGSFAKVGLVSVGTVSTLAALGSSAFKLFLGNLAGKINKAILFKAGAVLVSFSWLARYFIASPSYYYLLTVYASLAGAVLLIPFMSLMYSLAKERNLEEFIIFREIPVVLGRSMVYALAAIFVVSFKSVFVIMALVVLWFLFFSPKDFMATKSV